MTRRHLLALCIVLLLLGRNAPGQFPGLKPAGGPFNGPIKLVTWNLEWFPGGHPNASAQEKTKQMAAAKSAITKLSPDLLCLQEVKDWTAVAELVSVLPGFKVDVISSFYGDQQQAIASRLPADSAWFAQWRSVGQNDPPRGYSFAAYQRGAGFLLVYSLHLKANGRTDGGQDIAKREESSRQLLEHVAEMERLYVPRGKTTVLICGDLNTTLDPEPRFQQEKTLRGLLQSGFLWTGAGVPFASRISHPGSEGYPPIQFDHVLTKGLPPLKCRVQKVSGVSDHMPLLLTVP